MRGYAAWGSDKERDVPMVENIRLARMLAKEVEIWWTVPRKWHQAIAGVLAVVYKTKKAGLRGGECCCARKNRSWY
jgi:flagellar biosynthesis protein FlhB